jgi:hypothetical protein
LLYITRIKPNPAGKDRRQGQTSAQLAAEWVDFKNIGTSAVELYHRAYPASGGQPSWEKIIGFTGTLSPQQTVRVHSGSGPESALRDDDRRGAEHHVFTGGDYVWNNKQSDTPALYNRAIQKTLDSATYDANPPEGQVLARSGDKLVPSRAADSSR